MTADVAVRAREIRERLRPRARVWVDSGVARIAGQVCRQIAAAKEPHPDAGVTPFHRVGATAVGIQRCAECVLGSLDAAPRTVVAVRIAILDERLAGLLALDVHLAARGRVQGRLVAAVALVD